MEDGVSDAPAARHAKRMAPGAYQALREALPVVFHYKRAFESFVRDSLRDAPEIVAGLNFQDLKRKVADVLVARLAADERRYQGTTIQLMVDLGAMERFPDLESQE